MNTIAMKRPGARALTLALIMSLAGCDSTMPLLPASLGGSSAPATAAEKQLQEDEDRFNNTVFAGVATGAIVGAGVGALAALATGQKGKNVGKAAVGGAVIGGAVVGVDAYFTAKKEQAGRQGIRMTQAATADIQQDNRNLQGYLDSSNRVLAEGKARLAALKRDVAARKLSADEARSAREREERNIASMNTALTKAKETRAQYAETSTRLRQQPRENTAALDSEIRKMDDQIRGLEQNISAYRQALEVSRA